MRACFQPVRILHFAFEVFFLFAWLCVSSFGYAVPRIYSGYALTGYCL